jgi:flagellar motor component MotA
VDSEDILTFKTNIMTAIIITISICIVLIILILYVLWNNIKKQNETISRLFKKQELDREVIDNLWEWLEESRKNNANNITLKNYYKNKYLKLKNSYKIW